MSTRRASPTWPGLSDEDTIDESADDDGAQDETDKSATESEDNDFDSEDSHSEGESFLQTKMDANGDDECERGDVTLRAKNEDAADYSMNESLVSVDGPGVEGAWTPPLAAIDRIEVIRGPMSSLSLIHI